jgi:cephalosporin hydroxylase
MNEIQTFLDQRQERVKMQGENERLKEASAGFVTESIKSGYSYNFSWMGRPIIQYPQDMVAVQEIIWNIKPDLIIETGIAHGGSLIFYASILELIGNGEVLGIDIDIREYNRREIENHSMFRRIHMIQGSSVDRQIVDKVKSFVQGKEVVLVCLDSNHSHEHVLQELELYGPFVTANSYIVVFDTIVEDLPDLAWDQRPWSKGNNPKTAVFQFLKQHHEFEIDENIDKKILISVAPSGYLKRVK